MRGWLATPSAARAATATACSSSPTRPRSRLHRGGRGPAPRAGRPGRRRARRAALRPGARRGCIPSARPRRMGRMLSKPTRWSCAPYDVAVAERLAAGLGVSRPVGAILARRGLRDRRGGAGFLDADERHDPLDPARRAGGRELILAHLRRGSRGSRSSATTTWTASAPRPSWCAPCARSAPTRSGSCPAASTRAMASRPRRSSGWPRAAWACWSPSTAASRRSSRWPPRGRRARRGGHRSPPAGRRRCPVRRWCTRRWAAPCPELCAAGVVLKLCEALRRRPARRRGAPRPGGARHGLRPRSAARREPPHRARGADRAGAHAQARPAGADGGGGGRARPS